MATRQILFITNGHGEDTVAARLITTLLSQDATLHIVTLPIVGDGKILERCGAEILGPRRPMPSGGFIHHNLFGFLADIFFGGWIRSTGQILSILRKLRGNVDLVIAIGDMIPAYAAAIVGAPLLYVGINKSDYYQSFGYSYMGFEIAYLRRFAQKVFTRDEITAERLRRTGVNAEYVGNPMMDCISMNGTTSPKVMEGASIGFLPGTRPNDIPKNLEDFEKIMERLEEENGHSHHHTYLLALPEHLRHISVPQTFHPLPFSEVITKSDLIVGLSGTGNEQAAGLGKPVIAFPSRGHQYSMRFARAQQQLLGEAIAIVDRDPTRIAQKIREIAQNRDLYQKMSAAGQDRMGSGGAIPHITRFILS